MRRWDGDLLARLRDRANLYSKAIEAIDQLLADEATEAELLRRGAGAELILERLRQSGVLPDAHPLAVNSSRKP